MSIEICLVYLIGICNRQEFREKTRTHVDDHQWSFEQSWRRRREHEHLSVTKRDNPPEPKEFCDQAQTSQILLARPGVPHPDTAEFQPPAPTFDPYRTLRFCAFGVAIGPFVGVWMKFLERKFPLKAPGVSTGVQTAKRVFMDQFVL
jgi:hypothetical protein